MKWLLGTAGVILAVYVLWSWAFPTYTVRWRLTVEIDTPQGVRSGSSVLESSFYRTFGAMGGASASLRGEAVFVDLGDGHHIIAALAHGRTGGDSDTIEALPVTALMQAGPGWGAYTELKENRGSLEGEAVLESKLIPTLVTFTDIADPKTALIVDPTGDGFEKTFGVGTRFRQAKVEILPKGVWPLTQFGITGVPITTGIVKKLSWIPSLGGGYLVRPIGCNQNAEICLGAGSFRRN